VIGEAEPVAVHGVQHIFHPPVALRQWRDGERSSRLVIIVRDLDRQTVTAGWLSLGAQGSGPA